MKIRDLVALALIAVAIGLESVASYGTASFLAMDLYDHGEKAASVGAIMTARHLISLLGMLVGGAAAFGIGPRAAAAAGALVAAVGLLGIAAGAPLAAFACVMSFGTGVLRPCPIAAAAEALAWDDRSPSAPGPHRFAAVAAFAVVLAGASQTAAFIGPTVGGLLRNSSAKLVYGAGAALTILAAALLAAAFVLGLSDRRDGAGAAATGPYREGKDPRASSPVRGVRGPLLGVAILLVPTAIYQVGLYFTIPPSSMGVAMSTMWLYSVSSIGFGSAVLIVFPLLLVAAFTRWTVPPLLLYGAGLVVFALGLIPIAACGGSVFVFAAGAIVAGAGEAAVVGVPVTYAAIAVRGRAATLVVAAFYVMSGIVGQMASVPTMTEALRSPLIWASVLLSGGAGVALLVRGRALHRLFDPAPSA